MLFWVLIVLAILAFFIMTWGLISARKIAVVETSSESFNDEARLHVDTTDVDLDSRDGKIGIDRKFFYGKKGGASVSAKYSTADMAKAWQTGDRKLKASIAGILAGMLGIVIFPGLAFIANGGNYIIIGLGIIIVGLLGLLPFFRGFKNKLK